MNSGNLQRALMTTAIFAVLVLPSGTTWAATTGQLSGVVVDQDGAPLPGVRVSVSSPTQIGGARATETDVQGWFQYPRLNPGYFRVLVEIDGFLTQELTEVQVRLDRMTQVHVTMSPATFGDAVTVTETTPVIDPERVSTGQTFTEDFLQDAVVGTNVRWFYGQIPLLAAGTSSTWPGGESGEGWNISLLGSTGSENIFQVDGLDTSHPYWGGAQITLPFDSIQEVAFESGGFGAEFGRGTGGVINALTKSGSNVFSGTFDARYRDNSFETSGEHYDPDEQESKFAIAGATLGGRFVRDRAWFFASVESQQYASTPTGAPTTYEETTNQGFVKVTGQVSPSWLALGKYHRALFENRNGGSNQFRAPEATGRFEEDQSILQAEISGVLTQDLLWELQIGTQLAEEDWGPMSGDSSPISHYNYVTGMSTGNLGNMFYRNTGRDQLSTSLTWFVDDALGSHELKLGGEYLRTSLDQFGCSTGLAGGGFCRPGEPGYQFDDLADDEGEAIPYVMTVETAGVPYEVPGNIPSVFVQDAWRVAPQVTLQLGLRWDRAVFDDDVGETVADMEMLQPRLGVTWDLKRNGRNLLRASWGRFMNSSFLRLPRLAIKSTPTYESWVSCSTYVGLSDPDACAAVAASWDLEWRADPDGWDPAGWIFDWNWGTDPTQIASDLAPTYSDTLIVGFERELLRRTSLELSYVDKATRDIFEDTCSGNYPTPMPDAECDAFIVANIPQARRDYTAWILNFESRAVDRLHVLTSYTNSDSKGSIDSANVASADFDLYPYLFENRYGYLGYHRTHRVKASGYVFLPLDFGVGFSGVWGSPFRWTPVERAALISPGLWGNVFLEPRGSREGDEWSQLDVQATKAFNLGRVRLQLIGAVLNLFDSENATDVCERTTGCGDFAMGDATAWQVPRRYELGMRVEW